MSRAITSHNKAFPNLIDKKITYCSCSFIDTFQSLTDMLFFFFFPFMLRSLLNQQPYSGCLLVKSATETELLQKDPSTESMSWLRPSAMVIRQGGASSNLWIICVMTGLTFSHTRLFKTTRFLGFLITVYLPSVPSSQKFSYALMIH